MVVIKPITHYVRTPNSRKPFDTFLRLPFLLFVVSSLLDYSVGVLVGVCIAVGLVCILIGLLIGFNFSRRRDNHSLHKNLPDNDGKSAVVMTRSQDYRDGPNGDPDSPDRAYATPLKRPYSTVTQTTDVAELTAGDAVPPNRLSVEKMPLKPIYDEAQMSPASKSYPNGVSPGTPMSAGTPMSSGTPPCAPGLQRQPSQLSRVWSWISNVADVITDFSANPWWRHWWVTALAKVCVITQFACWERRLLNDK